MGLCHRSTLGGWTIEPPPNASPLLVFINTKSGGNHGVVLMRMFKGLLNPVQVFDLHKNGYVQARDNSVNPLSSSWFLFLVTGERTGGVVLLHCLLPHTGGGEALPINVLLSRSRVGSMPLSKRSCQLWCAVYIDITPRMTSYAIACHRMLNALRPGPGLKMMQHHEGTCAHDVLREPERALMVVLCPPPPPKTGGTKQPHLASVLSRSNSAIEFVLTCVIPMTSH